jgi:hypothetical protein
MRLLALASMVVTLWLGTGRAVAEPAARDWTLRLEGGVAAGTVHLHPTGGGGPPPLSLALSLELRLLPWLSVEGSGGALLQEGLFGAATARFVFLDIEEASVSVGAGPMAVDVPDVGVGLFAGPDLSLTLHLGAVALSARAGYALALNSSGARDCGVDTCRAYLARGDHLLLARAGVGYAF